jgi:hypothetical protein
VSARRRRSSATSPSEQLPLEAPPPPQCSHDRADVDQVAKAAIARRAKPSAIPGRVKLTFTLDLKRELAERLSARAIRETKNLEGVIADILEEGMR